MDARAVGRSEGAAAAIAGRRTQDRHARGRQGRQGSLLERIRTSPLSGQAGLEVRQRRATRQETAPPLPAPTAAAATTSVSAGLIDRSLITRHHEHRCRAACRAPSIQKLAQVRALNPLTLQALDQALKRCIVTCPIYSATQQRPPNVQNE